MAEYWTPEQQGKIAEAAARVRQDGTIFGTAVEGVGYVYGNGSVMYTEPLSVLHVTFTECDTVDLLPNTGHEERVAADKAAGKSPFVRLPKARPTTPSMEAPE